MHHSPFRRRWTGETATVNGMEERDRVDASTNLCSRLVADTGRSHLRPRPVDVTDFVIFFTQLWLLLAGDPSVLARLIYLIFVTRPGAVTGRRHLRHRPVEFIHLCWIVMKLSLLIVTCGLTVFIFLLLDQWWP